MNMVMQAVSSVTTIQIYKYLAMSILLFLSLWHVRQAVSRRLWMLPFRPSNLLVLNAATLALLSIAAKPPIPSNDSSQPNELDLLMQTTFICAVIGALMPSIASSFDDSTLWSNVAGIALLILSTNFSIFLNFFFYAPDPYSDDLQMHVIHNHVVAHILVMAILFLLLLVMLTKAMALQAIILDAKAIVSEQLDELLIQVKPGYKLDVMAVPPIWSWEVVENNTCIKLLMVLTSNPLNVVARAPFTAIVGALVLSSFLVVSATTGIGIFGHLVFVLISVWRWMWVALQEDRSCLSLLFDAEPSYWRQKVNKFQCKLKSGPHRSRPNVLKQGQYSFKEVLRYIAASFMLHLVVPINWVMVAIIRFTHTVSAVLMRNLIWVPIQALFMVIKGLLGRKSEAAEHGVTISSMYFTLPLGVVCLAGENACIVKQEFVGAATFIIQRQMKRAQKQPNLKALLTLLQPTPKNSYSLALQANGLAQVLDQHGAPCVENLHVEHGYQYGWQLTGICLLSVMTEIEVEALGMSEMSEAALEAYWQALDMVKVVDEQYAPCIVCSKNTYASACTSEWSKLPKKKYRWPKTRRQVDDLGLVDEIFKALLELTGRHIAEFNKTKSTRSYISAPWPLQVVVSYTMHTVCANLLRLWNDTEIAGVTNMGGGSGPSVSIRIRYLVEYIKQLLAEVLSCCLSNLPLALDMSMTEAVHSFNTARIEKGLFLVGQGKHLWAELQWLPLVSTSMDIPGHLRHWIIHPDLSVRKEVINDP